MGVLHSIFEGFRENGIRVISTLRTTIRSEKGQIFSASKRISIPQDGNGYFIVEAGSQEVPHSRLEVTTDGQSELELLEGASYTASTEMIVENLNRVVASGSENSSWYYTTDDTEVDFSNASVIAEAQAGGNEIGDATEGGLLNGSEWILDESEVYVVRVDNLASSSTTATLKAEFFEEEVEISSPQ